MATVSSREREAVKRVTLTVDEACVSRDHFERHIMGELRIIYCGRRRLVPVRELERWSERAAVSSRG